MNKGLIIFLVILVVVVGAWVVLKKDPVSPMASSSPTPSVKPDTTQQGNTVTYTDSGYLPATITIKKGQMVTWKNNGSREMWTASAIHPTHSVYPTTGGCLGSTFDACIGVVSGQEWSFEFNNAGTWKYHNHMNPAHYGTVIVE